MLFGVLDSSRRTRISAALAAPVALAVFITPGAILRAGVPSPGELFDWFVWMVEASFANRTQMLPLAVAAVVGTWVALTVLARLLPDTRRRALGGIQASLGAIVVAQTWHRPDLPAEYGQSAFADLGAATFLAALAIPLALAALLPRRAKPLL
jgi:asparagine N-glycosylation enzyme membrane subunit Stt3